MWSGSHEPPRHAVAATRRSLWADALVWVLALAGVALVGSFVVHTVRERSAIAALATPAPQPSATLTAPTSSLPTVTSATTTSSAKPPSPATSPKPATVVPFVPAHIWIPAIGVNTSIVPKNSSSRWDSHLNKTVMSFGVPTGEYMMEEVAWWSNGPRAGEHRNGQIPVLLGHTQINGYGVFNDLGNLKPGQVLTLAASDPHKVQRYRVLKVLPPIPKDDASALPNALKAAPPGADLAVITCSGAVDAPLASHKDNTVVFFTLVGGQG